MRKVFSLLFIASFLLMPSVVKAQPKLEKCNNGLFGFGITALAVQGNNIYAGTNYIGIYQSTDNGVSWTRLENTLTKMYISALEVSGKNLFAVANSLLYISIDNGAKWFNQKNGLDKQSITSIIVDSEQLVVVGAKDGVYYSTNLGANWKKAIIEFDNTSIKCLARYKDKILAGSQGSGVYVTSSMDSSWTASYYHLSNCDVNCLGVNNNTVFAGTNGGGIFLSTDGLLTWQEANNGLTDLKIQTLKVVDSNIYAGTEAGLFISTNNGSSWESLNEGMSSTNVLSITQKEDVLFVGTRYGGIYSSTNYGKNWTRADQSFYLPKINCIVSNDKNIYVGTEGSNLYRSTNNGDSWESISAGIRGSSIGSMTLNKDSLYVVADDVYSSFEGDLKWKILYGKCPDRFNSQIFIVGNDIYFTSNNAIHYANMLEKNWKRIGFYDLVCTAVIGDKIFAGKSAYSIKFSTYGGGIHLTTDYGASWKNIAYDKLFITKFFVQGSKLYAIVDGGIHLTTDYGSSWKPCKINSQYNFIQQIGGNGKDIVASNQDGEIFYSNNDGRNWRLLDTIRTITSYNIKGNNLFMGTTDKGIYRMDISDYVSVDEKPSAEEFSVYPNPAGDFITIEIDEPSEIIIYNMLGEKVMAVEQTSSSVQQIYISDLPKGMYFVKSGELTAKFVKI